MKNDPAKLPKDITSMKFGRWLVVRKADENKYKSSYWHCVCDCGIERTVRGGSLWNGKTQSCGCLISEQKKMQVGEKANNWKGGRRVVNGYIYVRDTQHANSDSHGYVAEHRKVMSDFLGRPLMQWEHVHHRNQIKTDNKLENLQLLTHTTHFGNITCPYCHNEFIIK